MSYSALLQKSEIFNASQAYNSKFTIIFPYSFDRYAIVPLGEVKVKFPSLSKIELMIDDGVAAQMSEPFGEASAELREHNLSVYIFGKDNRLYALLGD
jgi:hypothetical protein